MCQYLLAGALGVNVEGQSGLNAWEEQNHLVVLPLCSA